METIGILLAAGVMSLIVMTGLGMAMAGWLLYRLIRKSGIIDWLRA